MGTKQDERLTDRELRALFDRLFPDGFAGADVLAEIAPEGWEQSPLLACSHPSVERVFDETLQIHRNVEALCRARAARDGGSKVDESLAPEPTLDEVRREYQATPVRRDEEVTELVGQCLWDVFSDNHEVIVADGRVASIGSFRSASAFLDGYLDDDRRSGWREGDCMRFYMGTIWIAGRADLTPVYAMIFSRLRSLGADWIYHFPELGLVDLSSLRIDDESSTVQSPAEARAAEQRAREHNAEVVKLRAQLAEMNASAREEAMDRPPPTIVCAYRQIYGRDPRGWPPA
jgi:hypothetical protein